MDDMDSAIEVLLPAEKILVFTGAGISTESGIPDFRGPNGLWSRMDPDDFSIERYLADPEVRKRSWSMHRQGSMGGGQSVSPNEAHRAIVRLWQQGRLAGCVTQNIDGLHQAAGLPDEEVAELHGNLRSVSCTSCGATWPTRRILARVSDGEPDPRCERCGGILKTATVLFGEFLPEQAFERAVRMAENSAAVIAVGTTLTVFPAADIVLSVVHSGADLVIVNQGNTACDDLAAAILDGPAGRVLPVLVEEIGAHHGNLPD